MRERAAHDRTNATRINAQVGQGGTCTCVGASVDGVLVIASQSDVRTLEVLTISILAALSAARGASLAVGRSFFVAMHHTFSLLVTAWFFCEKDMNCSP